METDYMVLVANKVEGGLTDDYNQVGMVKASSAAAAMREVAESTGTYIAIPARSWKPTVIKVETKKVVTLG